MSRRELALALLLAAACKDTVSHIYAGRQYDPTNHCVEPTSTIDVVEGDDPGAACLPVCLVSPPSSTGQTATYVSKECAPYPPLFDISGNSPDCVDALLQYNAAKACPPDGGTLDGS
jgi:hypothetical protein